jgi:transposase InsO family protein
MAKQATATTAKSAISCEIADVAYIPTWTGLLYLVVVLDALGREIVGWQTASIT